MRKLLALLLVFCLVFCTVSAISEDEKVTLTFEFWGDSDEVATRLKMIELFEAEHPNIHIEPSYTDGPSYQTKIQMIFSSGETPDVLGMANDILLPYADTNLMCDLTELIERDGLTDVWNPIAMDVLNIGGVQYGAPFEYKNIAIAYNKTLFDAAGVAYPEKGWTEEDMLEKAKALTNLEGRIPQYGMYLGGFDAQMIRDLYGSPVYDVVTNTMTAENNAAFKHAVEVFYQMVAVDHSAPDSTTADTYGGGFETGMFGMALVAPWSTGTFPELIGDSFEWDIVELPTNAEFGHWLGSLYGDGWCIGAKSEHKEEAWEFIKFMTTTDVCQRIISDYAIPFYTAYAESEEYKTMDAGYTRTVFVDMLDYSNAWYSTGIWGRVNDVINTQYEKVLVNQMTIDEAIAAIQSEGTALLSE